MMHLTFHPMRLDQRLSLAREGDILTLNDEVLDFTALPDGATLPAEAFDSPWIAGDVSRISGAVHIALVLPHGEDAPHDTRFPAPITLTGNGPVHLPPHTAEK